MKLIVDVSSVVKTCLYAGNDKEFGYKVIHEGREVHVNGAQYGMSFAINRTLAKLKKLALQPRDMILVVEGYSSKALRLAMSDTYKGNRPEGPEAQKHEFGKARDAYVRTFLDLGAQAVSQQGVESDDVIAYLAKHVPACVIDSNDGDMAVLVSETAHTMNADNILDVNPYGPFPHKYVTLYKALVGDQKDNIKGARGFGDKAWLDLFCLWGEEGLEAMENLILTRTLERLVEDVGQLKSLQKIIDDMQGVYLSYDLARMYPEKVNTYRNPLKWQVGMVKPAPASPDPRLADFYGRRKVVHAGNYEASLAFIRAIEPQCDRFGLDIEGWSPEESDDWLEARKKRKAKDDEGQDLGVDVLGQRLSGLGLTLGPNDQFTYYFAIDHDRTDGLENITKEQLVAVLKLLPQDKPIVVHNASFELSVMHREVGALMGDNGWHGMLPNVHDTMVMASYVNENERRGLKELSDRVLGYQQVTYKEATKGRKMNKISATEIRDYACDDPICTLALYNHFKLVCEIEKTWVTYLEVEQMPAYLNALRFNQGTPISMEELLAQEREDKEAYEVGAKVVHQYLVEKGWKGTICPQVTDRAQIDRAFIMDAYSIVTGVPRDKEDREEAGIEDAFIGNLTKKADKLVLKMRELSTHPDAELLASLLDEAVDAWEPGPLNELLKLRFDNTPAFNTDSPKQVCRLLFEVMGLPIRFYKPLTKTQREKGQLRGNPQGDDLVVQYALKYDVKPEQREYEVLKALQAMKIASTRSKLYYVPYRTVCHWTDGLVHSYLNQCAAATRRYSESGPNKQQLPKHAKATGEPPKFRKVYIPHKRRAVVVSLDFGGQELRIIAERSQDPNLLACFIGDNKKDVHSLTASGILKKKALTGQYDNLWTLAGRKGRAPEEFIAIVAGWKHITYEEFEALKNSEWSMLYKVLRALGKKTNFTTEYGAMAPKLAKTMIIEEDEAQIYIDAKFANFLRSEAWKKEVIAFLHETGYTTTLMGARRHLAEGLLSGRGFEVGAAERQGVNAEIQSSAAEQTKCAEGRIWKSDILFRYDARYIGPVHDELVFSVAIEDLVAFITEAHALMTAPYGGMTVPIVSSISFGLNYGDQIEVGEQVNPQLINDVLYNGWTEGDKKFAALFPANDEQMREAA